MPAGYVHCAGESIPGNETNVPTLTTKLLYPPAQSWGPKTNPKHLMRDDEIRNQDEPLSVFTDSYEPDWEAEMRAYPDLLGFYLRILLEAPVSTAGDAIITDPDAVVIPVGATKHVWTAPFVGAGATNASPLTMQAQPAYKDQSVFFKQKGMAIEEFELETPEEGGAAIKMSGPNLYTVRQADPSLTPVYEALSVRPFVRGNLTLPTWLTGTGTTEDFSFKVNNKVEAVKSLGIASKFPDVMEKDNEGPVVVTGEIPKRQLDLDDWDALINATGFAAKAKWISDSIIASAYPYKLFFEMSNCQYVDGDPDPLSNKRRHGAKYSFRSTSAGAASTTITLVNATALYT